MREAAKNKAENTAAAWNTVAYMKALERLIHESGKDGRLLDPEFQSAVSALCGMLGVIRADAEIVDTLDPAEAETFEFYEIPPELNDGDSHGQLTSEKPEEEFIVRCSLTVREDRSEERDAGLRILLDMLENKVLQELEKRIEAKRKRVDPATCVYTQQFFNLYAEGIFNWGRASDYAACAFNLKGMNALNLKVGMENGTFMIKTYVCGLQELLGEDGIVARNSGDNFSTIFLKDRIDDVIAYLSGKEIFLENGSVNGFMSAHAGFYLITENCETPVELADILATAVRNAKENHTEPYVFYDDNLKRQIDEAKRIEEMFEAAIEGEEFLVYYQPKVELERYRLCGAEALCRWKHGDSMVLPFKFIPVFERNGDICTLDFYMLEHVCRDLCRWIDEGREVVRVSVNLSRLHLGNKELLSHILSVVDTYGIPHEYIEIELTETAIEVDYGELKALVSGLHEAGIHTSVDDYGIGYSSMNLLRELPWDVIKIDRSFIPLCNGDAEDEKRKIMINSMIEMVDALGLQCIAEGVETISQIILLKEHGCYLAQGYYFDKPLPVAEFERRLSDKDRKNQKGVA